MIENERIRKIELSRKVYLLEDEIQNRNEQMLDQAAELEALERKARRTERRARETVREVRFCTEISLISCGALLARAFLLLYQQDIARAIFTLAGAGAAFLASRLSRDPNVMAKESEALTDA